MTEFPITFDAEQNALLLDGQGGVTIMLGLLLKAKYGEAFDPDVLFHKPVAELMTALKQRYPVRWASADAPFTPQTLFNIANAIVAESVRSGWWTWSREEQAAYLQNVVAAPYRLSEEQLQDLLVEIAVGLDRRRQIVDAADGAPRGE